jgi:hypothetical protein
MKIDFIEDPPKTFQYWNIEPGERGRVLVRYEDKDPAWLETIPPEAQTGKVLLFTTTFDGKKPLWDNYLESSIYVVLAGLSTHYLSGGRDPALLNYIADPGKPPSVALPEGRPFVAYALVPGRGRNVAPPKKGNRLAFPEAQAPGNYIVEGVAGAGKRQRVAAFSVNLPPGEADVSPLAPGVIRDVFGPDALLPVTHDTNMRNLIQGFWREPVRLLPIVMLLVLILLAAEGLLGNLFYRKEGKMQDGGSASSP